MTKKLYIVSKHSSARLFDNSRRHNCFSLSLTSCFLKWSTLLLSSSGVAFFDMAWKTIRYFRGGAVAVTRNSQNGRRFDPVFLLVQGGGKIASGIYLRSVRKTVNSEWGHRAKRLTDTALQKIRRKWRGMGREKEAGYDLSSDREGEGKRSRKKTDRY